LLYVDGRGRQATATGPTGTRGRTGQPPASAACRPTSNFFAGQIDEVRLYDVALTAAQVAAPAVAGFRSGSWAPGWVDRRAGADRLDRGGQLSRPTGAGKRAFARAAVHAHATLNCSGVVATTSGLAGRPCGM